MARGVRPATGSGGKLDLADLPQFQYAEESLGGIVSRAAFDVVLLGALATGFFGAAYVSFLRYDVR